MTTSTSGLSRSPSTRGSSFLVARLSCKTHPTRMSAPSYARRASDRAVWPAPSSSAQQPWARIRKCRWRAHVTFTSILDDCPSVGTAVQLRKVAEVQERENAPLGLRQDSRALAPNICRARGHCSCWLPGGDWLHGSPWHPACQGSATPRHLARSTERCKSTSTSFAALQHPLRRRCTWRKPEDCPGSTT